MPRASVNTDAERFDLKTLPGAFVLIRRMPYGQWLHRQELALQLRIEASRGSNTSGQLAMANKSVTVFEFQQCIVDHNLFMDDEEQQLMDFRKPTTLDLLDPKVGNEIGAYITELHQFEAEAGNSSTGSAQV